MKYNIRINQQAIVKHQLDIDLIDAAILDFFESWVLTGNIVKLDDNGITYYWLDYKNLINEMPLLKIKSKDGVYRRIKKMCDQDLLVPHPNNQVIGKPFFAFGKTHKKLLFQEVEGTDETPKVRTEIRTGTDETREGYGRKSVGGTDEKSDNNNINDYSIKNNIIEYMGHPLPFQTDSFKSSWDEWLQHRVKEKKKKNTPLSVKKQFKTLAALSEQEAIRWIDFAIEKGWQSFYEPKISTNGNNFGHHQKTSGGISAVLKPGSVDYSGGL